MTRDFFRNVHPDIYHFNPKVQRSLRLEKCIQLRDFWPIFSLGRLFPKKKNFFFCPSFGRAFDVAIAYGYNSRFCVRFFDIDFPIYLLSKMKPQVVLYYSEVYILKKKGRQLVYDKGCRDDLNAMSCLWRWIQIGIRAFDYWGFEWNNITFRIILKITIYHYINKNNIYHTRGLF